MSTSSSTCAKLISITTTLTKLFSSLFINTSTSQTQQNSEKKPPQERNDITPQTMEGEIQHRTVKVNGINIHVAEKGPEGGPVILFVHGFPELWYTWRHQINALSSLGYRCLAPDLRGFGDSDIPDDARAYTCLHIVGDLVGILDALVPNREEKVFAVGHDWGAYMCWFLCLFRPDRVKALVNLSVAFPPRHPNRRTIQTMRAVYGDDYYVVRIQEPGDVEAEFSHMGTERALREFYNYRKPAPLFLPKGKGFGNSLDIPIGLPSWMSEEDIRYYTAKFEKTGFTGGLNIYRNLDLNWELTAPWTGCQVKVPVKFILGDLDLTYHSFGTKDYMHKGGFKRDVPFLQEMIVMEGVGHFINEEKADDINKHIYEFFQKF